MEVSTLVSAGFRGMRLVAGEGMGRFLRWRQNEDSAQQVRPSRQQGLRIFPEVAQRVPACCNATGACGMLRRRSAVELRQNKKKPE
jgi:hypothetical protein